MRADSSIPPRRRTTEEAVVALRLDLAKGFSAVKVMLDERFNRVERLERELSGLKDENTKLATKVAVLEERLSNHREVTGRFRTDDLKDRIVDLKEDKKLGTERWKAAAPIVVAVVTGGFALIVSIINLVLRFISGH